MLLLTNAGAGSADREGIDAAVRVLRAGGPVEVVVLDDDPTLDEALDRRGGRRLVVAGGDGTLHRVVSTLHRRGELGEVDIGLIPLGTGNDFARTTDVPLDAAEAAEVVLDGAVVPVDLVLDDLGDIAVNNVHLGVGAEASRRGAIYKERLGRLGYGFGLLRAAFTPAFRLDIDIDGERVAGRDRSVLEVSIGNGATVGGGLPLNPGADPTDHRLDVLVSFSTGRLGRISYGIQLVRGKHASRPDVIRRSCDAVAVAGEPFYTSADGEINGPVPRRAWHLDRGALRMVLARR
jgi:diacylglycerol kinase family enzyme